MIPVGDVCGLQEVVRVPGDKSVAHRALFFAAQAQGKTRIIGLPDGDDVSTTLRVIESLGARISADLDTDGTRIVVDGWGADGPSPHVTPDGTITLDCGNSGTTARFLLGLLAGYPGKVSIDGDASLRQRPMQRLLDPLRRMGLSCASDALPAVVRGTRDVQPISLQTPVASAQMKTALMFAAMQAHGESRIAEPAFSRDHTERLAETFGISVEKLVDGIGIAIRGPQTPCAPKEPVRIPGDPSSAAFWIAAALCVPNSDLTIEDVCINPTRMGLVKALQSMGATISVEQTGAFGQEPVGNIHVAYIERLAPCATSAGDSAMLIDEMPVLALVCALAQGESRIANVGELRYKECDRLDAIIAVLAACGAHAEAIDGDGRNTGIDLAICGNGALRVPEDITASAYRDHRIAMMWAVAAAASHACVHLATEDIEAIAVSYPGFLDEFSHRLGYAPIVCIE